MLRTPSHRPRLDLPADATDKVLELLGAVLLAAFLVTVAASWSSLPVDVPTHFSASGEPDSWGSRAEALILPAIALVQFVLLTVLARFPHRYNYMVTITAENAECQYRLARRLMHAMKLLVVALLFSLYAGAWAIAAEQLDRLPFALIWLPLLAIFGVLAWYLFMARRAR